MCMSSPWASYVGCKPCGEKPIIGIDLEEAVLKDYDVSGMADL